MRNIDRERAITEEEIFARGWYYDKRGVLVPGYKVKPGLKSNKMKHFNRICKTKKEHNSSR